MVGLTKKHDAAIKYLERKYGDAILMNLESDMLVEKPHFKTGLRPVDMITGIGGLPRGGLVEVYGAESVGKTTLAIQTAVQAQKEGASVLWIDYEHCFGPAYAEQLGLNLKRPGFWISQPECLEDGFGVAERLVGDGLVDMIVLDSIAAGPPRAELAGDAGDTQIGLHARTVTAALRQLTHRIRVSNACMVFINQLRSKINVTYGVRTDTTGGRALKFYALMRIEMRRIKGIKRRVVDEVTGEKVDRVVITEVEVTIAKNKVASPFKSCVLWMIHGRGLYDPVQVRKTKKRQEEQ